MDVLTEQGPAPTRTADIDRVFEDLDVPLVVLVEPESEPEVVRRLSCGRDQLLARRAPAVLFLQRAGAGPDVLQEEAALASFLRGSAEVDPDQPLDVDAERRVFEEKTGLEPEAWLARYRAGGVPDTLDASLTYLNARFLEEPAR